MVDAPGIGFGSVLPPPAGTAGAGSAGAGGGADAGADSTGAEGGAEAGAAAAAIASVAADADRASGGVAGRDAVVAAIGRGVAT